MRTPRASPVPLDGLTVLVVDDECDGLELVAELMRGSGATVVTASSAREALRAVAAHRPDVLVSDIGMPEIDGYTLLRTLRALDLAEGAQTPALALSAFPEQEARAAALAAGFNLYLRRPVDIDALVAAVSALAVRGRS